MSVATITYKGTNITATTGSYYVSNVSSVVSGHEPIVIDFHPDQWRKQLVAAFEDLCAAVRDLERELEQTR